MEDNRVPVLRSDLLTMLHAVVQERGPLKLATILGDYLGLERPRTYADVESGPGSYIEHYRQQLAAIDRAG